jgi:hypothetical protein
MNENTKSRIFETIKMVFEKWSKHTWFQIIIGFYMVIIPIGIVGYFTFDKYLLNMIESSKTSETIEVVQDELDTKKAEKHKNSLRESRHIYVQVKNLLNELMVKTDGLLIFMLEYHNGVENLTTRLPFYKFDCTILEYNSLKTDGKHTNNYILFNNESVYKYSILLDDALLNGDILVLSAEEFANMDGYANLILSNAKFESVVITNLENASHEIFGTLVCLYLTPKDTINKQIINQYKHKISSLFYLKNTEPVSKNK